MRGRTLLESYADDSGCYDYLKDIIETPMWKFTHGVKLRWDGRKKTRFGKRILDSMNADGKRTGGARSPVSLIRPVPT